MIKVAHILACCLALCAGRMAHANPPTVTGELKKWHRVTLTFDGPVTSESATPNPFRDYRLQVTFSDGTSNYQVPGFFAADGDAAESGADSGSKWRVHFAPDATGTWTYTTSFRTGPDIALSSDPLAGMPTHFDGETGAFVIGPTDKTGRDHRGTGRLRYVGRHHLQFAETGAYYLKGGADSPENFLAFDEFDQTPNSHDYDPHAGDWNSGDPTWRNGLGKNIIGALNYLSGKGMNSVYFLTMNVTGDGKDVWPWTAETERYRFDCSKLDQWEIVFSHMDAVGIMLHVITQETENDQLLDGGALGPERTLYYRELIARFSHHLAITWNLGEENTNTDAQRKQFATYFKQTDPYRSCIVVHTGPGRQEEVYSQLLGYPDFDGPSLQVTSNAGVIDWLDRSAMAGRKWVACYDEQAPLTHGVVPDANDYWHDSIRKDVLWGTLMAGGGGVEYYFGYTFPHNDLSCEDWRSRDHMWDLTRYALEFFQQHIPFDDMQHANEATANPDDFCLAGPGQEYAIYLPNGGTTDLDVGGTTDTFSVEWYDPRHGGALQPGTITVVTGPGVVSIGLPPNETTNDWVALVQPTFIDACPDDPDKTHPGVCGCGIPDTDSDGDGVADCIDGCPADATKTEPGACGCGLSDVDANANNVPDCLDPAAFQSQTTYPNGLQDTSGRPYLVSQDPIDWSEWSVVWIPVTFDTDVQLLSVSFVLGQGGFDVQDAPLVSTELRIVDNRAAAEDFDPSGQSGPGGVVYSSSINGPPASAFVPFGFTGSFNYEYTYEPLGVSLPAGTYWFSHLVSGPLINIGSSGPVQVSPVQVKPAQPAIQVTAANSVEVGLAAIRVETMTGSCGCRGDGDSDGDVDGRDVQYFVDAFFNQATAGLCTADLDRNLVLDYQDVNALVSCLLDPACATCP